MASSSEQVQHQQQSASSSSSSFESRLNLGNDLVTEATRFANQPPEGIPAHPVYTLLAEMAEISDNSYTRGDAARQDLRRLQLDLIQALFDYRVKMSVATADERHYLAIDFDDTMSRSFFPNGIFQSTPRASFIRPMEAFFAQMRSSSSTQIEIFSHKTTFEAMQPERQKAIDESYLQFLLKHPGFDVYTSDDLLYTDVPEGVTGFSSRDIALPLMRRFYDDEGRFRPDISDTDIQTIAEALSSLDSAPDKQDAVKALVARIQAMNVLSQRRAAIDGEAETVGSLVTACHQHYYQKIDHNKSKSMLKADMLAHRLRRKDAASFATTALIDDAFNNIGAFILSALDNGKIPFAIQVVKGHPAFTLREHVIFETVQTDILQGLYGAFVQKDRHALERGLGELRDFYALIDANHFTDRARTRELQQLIPALVQRFNVDPQRIQSFYDDIPQQVKDCEHEAQVSRVVAEVQGMTEAPEEGESFFSRHKEKFATAGFIAILTLGFAPLAVVLGVVLLKTLPLFAAILIPAAVLAAVVAVGVAIRHHVINDGNDHLVPMGVVSESPENGSCPQEPGCFSGLFSSSPARFDHIDSHNKTLSIRPD